MMLNSLNTMKVKPMNLQLNNLSLNKRFTLLSSKDIGIIDNSNEREIMTRHQSERAHIKIYFDQMKRIYEVDKGVHSQLTQLGIKPSSCFRIGKSSLEFDHKWIDPHKSISEVKMIGGIKPISKSNESVIHKIENHDLQTNGKSYMDLCKPYDYMYTSRMIKLEYLNMVKNRDKAIHEIKMK